MTDHVDDDDDRDPHDDAPRVRVVTRRPLPKATRRTVAKRPSGRGRRGAEVALGAVIVMAGSGVGAYLLALHVLGWPGEVAAGVAGFMAGVCSGGVVWPIWRAVRLAVADFVHPSRSRA